jgi:ATP-dependent protease HslVU (ClpYQ) peptidase subunit
MTCIVAVSDGKKAVMGADSAGVAGYFTVARGDKKMFRVGGALMGGAGSFREIQALECGLKASFPKDAAALRKYLRTKFVDNIRKVLKDAGCVKNDIGVETMTSKFLLAVHGRVFNIQADFQVGENCVSFGRSFDAAGCGHELAMGAMHAALCVVDKPSLDYIATAALVAAETFSAGVRGPYHFEKL